MSNTPVEAMPIDQKAAGDYTDVNDRQLAKLCAALQQHNALMSKLIDELTDVKNELHHIGLEIARK